MTAYLSRPDSSPTTGLIIASTAAGDSTLAFATSPSSLPFGIDALSASMRLDDSRVHRVFDHDAGALAQCVRGRGDRDGAFRPAFGSFDSREPQEREAGPLWAADSFVRLHAEAECALRRSRIAGGECGPAHLAVHARDLGLIADRGERLERLAVEDERTRRDRPSRTTSGPGS